MKQFKLYWLSGKIEADACRRAGVGGSSLAALDYSYKELKAEVKALTNQELADLCRSFADIWSDNIEDDRQPVLAQLSEYAKTDVSLHARLVAMISLYIFGRSQSTVAVEEFLDNIYQPEG